MEITHYRFVIERWGDSCRVDDYLSTKFPLLSRTKLRALIGAGAARCAGAAVSRGQRLRAGEIIEFEWDLSRVPGCPPEAMPLEIVWEDSEVVAVNKPAGMLVHPTRGVKVGTLTNGLLAYLNPNLNNSETVRAEGREPALWPKFIHRLDRDTSGIILAAKTRESASLLGKAFAARCVLKSYLAIVEGRPPEPLNRIEAAVRRFDDGPPHWRASGDGQSATSIVELLTTRDGLSLVCMEPVTGRTNQLRIHAAVSGTPILGDVTYGGSAASGLMLHASRLTFPHPASGERVEIAAPIPERFREAWPGIDELIRAGRSSTENDTPPAESGLP